MANILDQYEEAHQKYTVSKNIPVRNTTVSHILKCLTCEVAAFKVN